MVERLYVATELAREERISVATRAFYVTTELAMTESSAAHEKAECAKVDVHDSVAPCCVMTEEARCARQALGVHDRGACKTGEFCV